MKLFLGTGYIGYRVITRRMPLLDTLVSLSSLALCLCLILFTAWAERPRPTARAQAPRATVVQNAAPEEDAWNVAPFFSRG